MQSWFEQHKDTLQDLPCSAQSPDLLSNHCGQGWVRSRIPPLSSLNGLDVHKNGTIFRYKLFVTLVSLFREAVLQVNGDPTQY
jgi:hypothetical protein